MSVRDHDARGTAQDLQNHEAIHDVVVEGGGKIMMRHQSLLVMGEREDLVLPETVPRPTSGEKGRWWSKVSNVVLGEGANRLGLSFQDAVRTASINRIMEILASRPNRRGYTELK